VRSIFKVIIEKFGVEVFYDEPRLRGLLSDLSAGQFVKERKQIKSLYECNIEKTFLNAVHGAAAEKQLAISKARHQMDEKLGLKQEDIDVLVECFVEVVNYEPPSLKPIQSQKAQGGSYSREENLSFLMDADLSNKLWDQYGINNWKDVEALDDSTLNELRLCFESCRQ